MKGKKLFWPQLYHDTPQGMVLVASKCKTCGEVTFPPNEMCVYCCGTDTEEIELPRAGKLYTYTVTRRPVDRWPADHGICQVTFPEQKVRIIGPMHMDTPDDKVAIGEEMTVTIEKYWDEGDDEVYGYTFCPSRLLKKEGNE